MPVLRIRSYAALAIALVLMACQTPFDGVSGTTILQIHGLPPRPEHVHVNIDNRHCSPQFHRLYRQRLRLTIDCVHSPTGERTHAS